MDRLGNYYKESGISISALRIWGMVFLAAGVISRGVLQKHILGITGMQMGQMLQVMLSGEEAMNHAAMAIALQALETCAAPIFAVLLVEGFVHTSDFGKYFLRVLGISLVTEIPYNLAFGWGVLDFSGRNPMFSLVLGLLLMYFYQRYEQRSVQNMAVRILVTIAALAWVKMLNIAHGMPMLVLVVVLWALRDKPKYRNPAGAAVALCCSVLSPFFLVSPLAFLAIHICNGEKNEENRVVNYLMYPGLLLIVYAVGRFFL